MYSATEPSPDFGPQIGTQFVITRPANDNFLPFLDCHRTALLACALLLFSGLLLNLVLNFLLNNSFDGRGVWGLTVPTGPTVASVAHHGVHLLCPLALALLIERRSIIAHREVAEVSRETSHELRPRTAHVFGVREDVRLSGDGLWFGIPDGRRKGGIVVSGDSGFNIV